MPASTRQQPRHTKGWKHLNNAETNRPSLLSDGTCNAATSANCGRILADMDGNAASSPSKPLKKIVPGSGRFWRWLLGIVTLALIIGLILVLYSDQIRKAQSDIGEYALTPVSNAPTGHPETRPQPAAVGAARIIDVPIPVIATPSTEVAPPAPLAPPPSQGDGKVLAADKSQPAPAQRTPRPAPTAAAAKAPRTAAHRPQVKPATAQKSESLLGTLMGIIKDEKKTSGSATQPASMDELVAQIGADQAQGNVPAPGTSAARRTASTDSVIQTQLRRCPAANTPSGVECRRRICAGLGSGDPACPAPSKQM